MDVEQKPQGDILQQPTKVFAIAGLDGRAIGSKTLISYSSG